MADHGEIPARIARVRPALNALRFYTATTRGFRDRERARLAAFLQDVAERELQGFTADELKAWLKTKAGYVDTSDYRSGDTAGYLALLRAIPPALLERTRDYALLIARGSGRLPVAANVMERIQREFSQDPYVVPPVPDPDAVRLGVAIDVSAFLRGCD